MTLNFTSCLHFPGDRITSVSNHSNLCSAGDKTQGSTPYPLRHILVTHREVTTYSRAHFLLERGPMGGGRRLQPGWICDGSEGHATEVLSQHEVSVSTPLTVRNGLLS